MKVQGFLHRHYSAAVGESPAAHTIVIVTGLLLMMAGSYFAMTVAFLPVAFMITLVGLFLVIEGVFAHMQRPMRFQEVLEDLVGVAGGAIAVMFALSVIFLLVFFGVGAFAALMDWMF